MFSSSSSKRRGRNTKQFLSIRYLGLLLVLVLSYSLAGSFCLWFASVNGAVTPLWAPTGIAIAAMVFYGYRVWPAIIVGSLVTGLVSSGTPSSITIGIVASLTEAFVATYCINKFAQGKNVVEKVKEIAGVASK